MIIGSECCHQCVHFYRPLGVANSAMRWTNGHGDSSISHTSNLATAVFSDIVVESKTHEEAVDEDKRQERRGHEILRNVTYLDDHPACLRGEHGSVTGNTGSASRKHDPQGSSVNAIRVDGFPIKAKMEGYIIEDYGIIFGVSS